MLPLIPSGKVKQMENGKPNRIQHTSVGRGRCAWQLINYHRIFATKQPQVAVKGEEQHPALEKEISFVYFKL